MPDAKTMLPLKPLVFETLLALADEPRHGWSLVREIQQRLGGERILPANFYRTLRGMLADGLIEEAPRKRDEDERRRYFALTTLGRQAAKLEVRRMEGLVAESRAKRLVGAKR